MLEIGKPTLDHADSLAEPATIVANSESQIRDRVGQPVSGLVPASGQVLAGGARPSVDPLAGGLAAPRQVLAGLLAPARHLVEQIARDLTGLRG
ncbi:MAG: hypothetical protein E4H22_01590 [Solirubrobacterales bacterium]|nr:MAG: hypothetical protein E4H22_01590 [Solirubrobacterales bacterium]